MAPTGTILPPPRNLTYVASLVGLYLSGQRQGNHRQALAAALRLVLLYPPRANRLPRLTWICRAVIEHRAVSRQVSEARRRYHLARCLDLLSEILNDYGRAGVAPILLRSAYQACSFAAVILGELELSKKCKKRLKALETTQP